MISPTSHLTQQRKLKHQASYPLPAGTSEKGENTAEDAKYTPVLPRQSNPSDHVSFTLRLYILKRLGNLTC